MKKKILSSVLATTLTLSATTMVFAEDALIENATDGVYAQNVTVGTTTKVPVIKVTVPTTADIVINPYKLAVEVDSVEYTDSIVTVEQTITNESDVPIAISAKVKAEVPSGSEATVATAALKGTETTKSVFAYLEVVGKETADAEAVFAESYDSKAVNQVAFTTKEVTKSEMVQLAAGDTAATYAGFKIFGDASSTPSKAWTEADTVTYSVTFNFEPVVAQATE